MKTLIILNGAPRSGKNTIAEASDCVEVGFKRHLLKTALAMSGVGETDWNERYDLKGTFIGCKGWYKDEPWDLLGGLSQRQYLIKVSEEWMKPVFGKDVFGVRLKADLDAYAEQVKTYRGVDSTFISSDGGFVEELEPFLADDDWTVGIARLHREGCNFDGDSRNYLHEIAKYEIDIENNGDIVDAVQEVADFIKIVKGE